MGNRPSVFCYFAKDKKLQVLNRIFKVAIRPIS